MTEEYIGRALKLAYNAHKGQKDKQGVDYILHPLNVGMRGSTEEELVVGLLHDTVEDTDVTLEQLAKLFPPDIVSAVDALTRREGESYKQFIQRICDGPELAIRAKLNDIAENTRPDRPHPDQARLKKKYDKARVELERVICETCKFGGYGPSHDGSPLCKCGSIASGGTKAHCACRACF